MKKNPTDKRMQRIANEHTCPYATYKQKIDGFTNKTELDLFLVQEPEMEYNTEIYL